MKFLFTYLFLFFLFGCNNTEKATKSGQVQTMPIIETEQVVVLSDEEEFIIKKTLLEEIQFYTENCKREKKKKILDKILFLEIFSKNPSLDFLSQLNSRFKSNKKIVAAKDGVSVYKYGLLVGYKHNKNPHVDI